MYYFLLSLLLLDAIVLMVVVLLQAGKGGGLAAMGAAGTGADTLFGTRHAATLLTKATWWTGGIFLTLSFGLSMLAGGVGSSESILRSGVQPVAPAPTTSPALPGTLQPTAPTVAPGTGAEPAPPPTTEVPQGQ